MCGIAGFVGPGARDALPAMLGTIAHRGPDDAGLFYDDTAAVGLAHRRLSIIDTSAAGHQPMARGALRIVYNGEVYNYAALRAELEALGETFVSHTDTEVILAGYARWGAAVLPRLRGMFAFAVWDAAGGELFLARDRFGIKPLYHATAPDGSFLFASEVRAVLASGRVPRQADPQAVWDYLSHGAVAQPRTIVRGVRALLPGHWLRLRPGGEPVVERWWDLEAETRTLRRELAGIGYAEAVEGVRARLDEATRLHLIADVPVGAFLSGGIDSTLVVGLMSRLAGHPIRTYSVGFDTSHAALSELAWARLAAERFGAEHTEVVVTGADAARVFDRVVGDLDQPSVDGTNTWLVSEAARTGVTVSLSGLGGDELFAGYPHFHRLQRMARMAPAGVPAARALAGSAGALLPGRWRMPLQALVAAPDERLSQLRRLMTDGEKRRAVSPAFRRALPDAEEGHHAASLRPGLDPLAQVSYTEATGYMRDTLLRDADAMSMAHSLEVRPVLLDHGLAEYAFALPPQHKLRGRQGKRVLIDAAADVLPREIVERPKMGFELPLTHWLKTTLRGRAREMLASPPARALFAPGFLRGLEAEADGGRSRSHRLWAYTILAACLEHHGLELPA
ncbi:asparagine synthase (glutamine-hydrolyzing) [Longimicrobium sp.]|uniref:asparagine synthase (glutamine-hydrolyzing) n=1 Tax=Longimicrobium sp. TaxID=2029185 RepID=UPI002E311268|nr:asparagine synthase (glutamine-hydrolyzing) [Longimicrobium sp.]HEX6041332.1 asparagine synthase (glutamine-hydrolyzing) [Longimicrobium sp.]